MTKSTVIKKNLELSSDFNSYASRNPKALKKVPKSACIVFISNEYKKLSKRNLEIAKDMKSKGKSCYVAEKNGRGWNIKPLEKVQD